MSKPLIAVTMGDPAGVGPEVCLQLIANEAVREFARVVVFGDAGVLSNCARQVGLPEPACVIPEGGWDEVCATLDEPAVLDIPGFDKTDFLPGIVSARTGAAGYRYVMKSIEIALAGQISGVATAPLNKEALRAAGILYPGHTEIFSD
ncbi:MAG TPA: 4-hydroxythreonine-4-phosphate dehydrogenase PdxA, partial [Verrucomicrobiales bacterium]|nr:4-hydroxythreonine-4-phosphate dehydrogenase PdxA [Verrucomicrobiales bacterium]